MTFQIGIKAKLWLAFTGLALMACVVSLLSISSMTSATTALDTVTSGRIPTIVSLAQLAQRTNSLIAVAPAVVFSDNIDQLKGDRTELAVAEEKFVASLKRVREAFGETHSVREIEDASARMNVCLTLLLEAMAQRGTLVRSRSALVQDIGLLRAELRRMIDEGRAETEAIRRSQGLLDRTVSLLLEASETTDVEDLARLEILSRSQIEVINEELSRQSAPASSGEAGELVVIHGLKDRLSNLMFGNGSVFSVRRNELEVLRTLNTQFQELRLLSERLNDSIAGLTAEIQSTVLSEREDAADRVLWTKVMVIGASLLVVVIAILVSWLYVGRNVVRRLTKLDRSMRAIAGGELNAPIAVAGSDEISAMGQALCTFRDAMARVAHMARHDGLTGLPNRLALEEVLDGTLRGDSQGALIYISLDGLSDINDTFGHSTGDAVLRIVAERLQAAARREDKTMRLGGDNYVILAPGITPDNVIPFAERLMDMLGRPIDMDTLTLEIGSMFGAAFYPEDATDPRDLLTMAETAVHAVGTDGALGRLRLYRPKMARDRQERRAIRGELRHAIEQKQFHLLYQPKMDIASGTCVGMEALVRWDHPLRGRISPLQFIPVAERSGLILALGEWVLGEACRQTREWIDMGLGSLKVAVNVSAVQFKRQDLVGTVERALKTFDLSPECIELEITESVIMSNEVKVLDVLERLRNLGVTIAIDDFGTGYSSLGYLKRLNATCLKIDQSFVREMRHGGDDMRIARAILNIARDFGLEVVAEGIETHDQLAFLRAEGCHFGQGYLFGKPMEPEDFVGFVRQEPSLAIA